MSVPRHFQDLVGTEPRATCSELSVDPALSRTMDYVQDNLPRSLPTWVTLYSSEATDRCTVVNPRNLAGGFQNYNFLKISIRSLFLKIRSCHLCTVQLNQQRDWRSFSKCTFKIHLWRICKKNNPQKKKKQASTFCHMRCKQTVVFHWFPFINIGNSITYWPC